MKKLFLKVFFPSSARALNMAEKIEYFSPSEISDDELPNFDLFPELFNTDSTKQNESYEKQQLAQIDSFISENANRNTVKKTKSDLTVWRRWLNKESFETRELEDIPPERLDVLLSLFFMNVRKLDGGEYELQTFTCFQMSFDRHHRQMGKSYSIISDKEFEKSRTVLKSKLKSLRRQGKGQKPNKAQPLTTDEIEKLWEEKQLGGHSPQSLIRTVWFNNTVYFGWRARDEHRKLRFGDIQFRRDVGDDQEYAIWLFERGSKTRSGATEFCHDRQFCPRMYATGNDRCPVKFLKFYMEHHRPEEMRNPDGPFYLAIIQSPKINRLYGTNVSHWVNIHLGIS